MKRRKEIIIRSGGQSGVDRAALDAARFLNIKITGFVPKGGMAEDYLPPKSLLDDYPELKETESTDVNVRTELNVLNSDLTLIFGDINKSPGTKLTRDLCTKHCKTAVIVGSMSPEELYNKVQTLGEFSDINIAGPRESEEPGIYKKTYNFLIGFLNLLILSCMEQTKQDKRTLTKILNDQKVKMPLMLYIFFLIGLIFTFLALFYFIFGGVLVYDKGEIDEVYSWHFLINNKYVTLDFVIGVTALLFFGIFFFLFGSYIFTKSQFYSAHRARTRKLNDNGAKWSGVIVIILGVLLFYGGYTLMRKLPDQLTELFPADFGCTSYYYGFCFPRLSITWGPKLTMIYGLIVAFISSIPLVYSFVLKLIFSRSENEEEEVNYFFSRKNDAKTIE
jgi:uncharacterized membrane protein